MPRKPPISDNIGPDSRRGQIFFGKYEKSLYGGAAAPMGIARGIAPCFRQYSD